MNGGYHGTPGARSPVLASCSPQKMRSWMLSCCLALQVRGGPQQAARVMGRGLGSSQVAGAASCQAKGAWGSGQGVLAGERAVVGAAWGCQ